MKWSNASISILEYAFTSNLSYWNASYNASNSTPIKQILTQNGYLLNGYEGWIEFRKNRFPIEETISASLNSKSYSGKNALSCRRRALNRENYNVAAGATDNNSINFPVWWNQ
jgi:hypothetical protein